MDNFLYCYLSPFLVGLLALMAIVLAIIGVIALIYFLGSAADEKYSDFVWGHATVKRISDGIGRVFQKAIVLTLVISFGTLFAFLFWSVGLDILKRVVCR